MMNPRDSKPGFWARQFASEVSAAQTVFDVCFGVVLPVVCLVADPVVFKGSDFLGGGMFAHYALPAYMFVGGSVLAMAFWLASRRLAILFAGPFFLGAVVSLGIGTVLLPLSLLMVVVGIGLLGLVPFGTAFTFLRGSVRARRAAEARHAEPRMAAALLLTAALAAGIPAGAHLFVQRGLAQARSAVLSDRADERAHGVASLRRYDRFLPGTAALDRLVEGWQTEADPAHKARLAEAYEAVAGGSIEVRWSQLNAD